MEVRFNAVVSQNLNINVLFASALTEVESTVASEYEPLQPSHGDRGPMTPVVTEAFLSSDDALRPPLEFHFSDADDSESSNELAIDSAFEELNQLW